MADFSPLLKRAIAGLEKNTAENRRVLYDRARAALVAQLRGVTPPLLETDITRERLGLEEAIRKIEAEFARGQRPDAPTAATRPPLPPGIAKPVSAAPAAATPAPATPAPATPTTGTLTPAAPAAPAPAAPAAAPTPTTTPLRTAPFAPPRPPKPEFPATSFADEPVKPRQDAAAPGDRGAGAFQSRMDRVIGGGGKQMLRDAAKEKPGLGETGRFSDKLREPAPESALELRRRLPPAPADDAESEPAPSPVAPQAISAGGAFGSACAAAGRRAGARVARAAARHHAPRMVGNA